MTAIQPGDLCTWNHVPRGGWGRIWPVDVVVDEVRGEKARVIAPRFDGTKKKVWVNLASLRRWSDQGPAKAEGTNNG